VVNTSFEIIEKLEQNVLTMEKDIGKLKKLIAGAIKASGTFGNTTHCKAGKADGYA
jgi:DNA anti-recombination protein RmuC